ncbi:MAG: hypothetical protein A3H97_20725 [Acidobacteria bacterium RIFCSPLOWO2_02_FULL_65_29]|nr:MAG: hypothetical protein A3H97_20725 [Acidobacteria bacterium RIFCSPLOWO2_02_FULL_65_29]
MEPVIHSEEACVNSELEGYQDQLLSINQDAPGIVAGLSNDQFNWRPGSDRWSIAECLGHLNIAARLFMPTFDEAIARGRRRGMTAGGPFAYPLLQRSFVRLMEPPPVIRVRTPGAFAPVYGATSVTVMTDFFAWQAEFLERLKSADGLDLRRIRARSPVLPWLRYGLGIAFAAYLAHQRRHLWQARQVRLVVGRWSKLEL